MTRFLLLSILALAAQTAERPLHPQALHQITCWASDMTEPVITQFSLDAIEKNHNQFNYDQVVVDGEWVRWKGAKNEGTESCDYKVAEVEPGLFRYELFVNGSGTLTIRTVIDARIVRKDILVDGKAATVRVFDVIAVDSRPQTAR